jgi:two-component system response regulator WspF
MRIAIVDDTLMSVIALRRIIENDEQHSVAWVASNGAEAVKACSEDTPDIILMDIIMPVMDGVEATKKIMQSSPCAILLVTSNVNSNATKVFEAMGAGALDVINTPILDDSTDEQTDHHLLNKIATIGKLISLSNKKSKAKISNINKNNKSIPLITIGSSTGGPTALVDILCNIPENFPACFIIVQHVDQQFIEGFVRWLNEKIHMPVNLAKSGDTIKAGTVLVSNSKNHLILSENKILNYTSHPKDYPYIPSVDVFFDSVSRCWEGAAMGVLLTGMGRDGAKGLLEMKNKGFTTIAQEKSTCAVYGMPKAAVDINAANLILSPLEINSKIVQYFADKDFPNKNNNTVEG